MFIVGNGYLEVLNLIITGIPSIRIKIFTTYCRWYYVLNLIITGIPSILYDDKRIS